MLFLFNYSAVISLRQTHEKCNLLKICVLGCFVSSNDGASPSALLHIPLAPFKGGMGRDITKIPL
jgi:hypothetical protein